MRLSVCGEYHVIVQPDNGLFPRCPVLLPVQGFINEHLAPCGGALVDVPRELSDVYPLEALFRVGGASAVRQVIIDTADLHVLFSRKQQG